MTAPYLRSCAAGILGLLVACSSSSDQAAAPPAEAAKPESSSMVGKPVSPAKDKKTRQFADAELLVKISFTEGSRGRSPRANQSHVTVADDKLYFAETSHGLLPAGGTRNSKVVDLTPDQRTAIARSIVDLELFEIETVRIGAEPDRPHAYASASLEVRYQQREHESAIAGVTSVAGRPTAFAATKAYRNIRRFVADARKLAGLGAEPAR